MSRASDERRFVALRERHQTARAHVDDIRRAMWRKYGPAWSWLDLSVHERRGLERAEGIESRSVSAFFGHLKRFSPRDWTCGVPRAWVLDELTFEDAARPASEKLSVVPPLAYGCSEPLS